MHENPRGLYGLLFAEFWERFSCFAVLSTLALYLNECLHLTEGSASAVAGTFVACAYLTPLFGGWLADRGLGSTRTLLAGTAFMIVGYAVLMHTSRTAVYTAIALLTLGSGLFKPNVTTWLGNLFDGMCDPRRPAGFRALFLCINFAAAAAPVAIGAIQSRVGWPAAFGVCALSMILCFGSVLWTRRVAPEKQTAKEQTASIATSAEQARALAVLCIPGIAFFAVFNQSIGALIFWARDRVDLTLGGWLAAPLAPASTCAVVPILAIVLVPTIEPLRRLLNRLLSARTPSTEIGVALVLTAMSFLLLVIPEVLQPEAARHHAGWLLGSYVFVTFAELLLLPLSLSLVEAIAPPRRVATYTGIYYLGVAAGSQLGSDAARLWGTIAAPLYFLLVACIPLVACGLLFVLRHYIDRAPGTR